MLLDVPAGSGRWRKDEFYRVFGFCSTKAAWNRKSGSLRMNEDTTRDVYWIVAGRRNRVFGCKWTLEVDGGLMIGEREVGWRIRDGWMFRECTPDETIKSKRRWK